MAKMSDIERELAAEIRYRKNVGNQAKRKKGGSKSKKCSLPSDHYTKKQLKGLNGEIMIRSLSKPMKWDEFKSMPSDLQEEYLKKLHDVYGASMKQAAEMFDVCPSTLSGYARKHGIKAFPASGNKRKQEEEAKWQAFLTDETPNESPEAVEQPAMIPEEPVISEVQQPLEYQNVKRSPMFCEASICLNFHGKFDLISFMETILKHIDEGQEVCLNVNGTIIEN